MLNTLIKQKDVDYHADKCFSWAFFTHETKRKALLIRIQDYQFKQSFLNMVQQSAVRSKQTNARTHARTQTLRISIRMNVTFIRSPMMSYIAIQLLRK